MKTSFEEATAEDPKKPTAKTETPASEKTATPPGSVDLALVDDDDSAVTVRGSESGLTGDISSRDMRFSRLNIVQKSGALADLFKFGAFVINKEEVLVEAPEKDKPSTGLAGIVCVKAQKIFREFVPYGSGVQGRVFLTEKEATDEGFGLDYDDDPKVKPELRCLFFVPQPEGVDMPHIFTLDSPVGPGALIGFSASSTAYNTVGVAIINAAVTFLSPEKGGLLAHDWTMSSEPRTYKGNTWHQAKIKPGKPTTPELVGFLKSLKF